MTVKRSVYCKALENSTKVTSLWLGGSGPEIGSGRRIGTGWELVRRKKTEEGSHITRSFHKLKNAQHRGNFQIIACNLLILEMRKLSTERPKLLPKVTLQMCWQGWDGSPQFSIPIQNLLYDTTWPGCRVGTGPTPAPSSLLPCRLGGTEGMAEPRQLPASSLQLLHSHSARPQPPSGLGPRICYLLVLSLQPPSPTCPVPVVRMHPPEPLGVWTP